MNSRLLFIFLIVVVASATFTVLVNADKDDDKEDKNSVEIENEVRIGTGPFGYFKCVNPENNEVIYYDQKFYDYCVSLLVPDDNTGE